MASFRRRGLLGVIGLACLAAWPGCSSSADGGGSLATVVTSRTQLVGGDRALGEIGDFLMQNEKIRVVVQQPGYSRGFGVYGGSLIDADLRRPTEVATNGAGSGYDNFGELFPAFFVQAVNVDGVRVLNDGKNGKAATVEAAGKAGDFLELAAMLNRAVTGSNTDMQNAGSTPRIRYTTTYELTPGKRYVTIHFKVANISNDVLKFPSDDAKQLLDLIKMSLDGFIVPVGDVALYGSTSEVFIPGVGFDLRFGLQDAYARKIPWPAFPGFAAEFVASRGPGTSYGILPKESDSNYVYQMKKYYDDGRTPITKSSLLIPFVATSFVGVFYGAAPPQLAPKESFEIEKYFIVGSGDVGSVLDTVNEIKQVPVGTLGGQVVDAVTSVASEGSSVLVYQHLAADDRRVYSQYDVRAQGYFGGTLEPGNYSLRVTGAGRPLSPFVDFTISPNASTSVRIETRAPGRVFVHLTDEEGNAVPAKVTAVGRYSPDDAGRITREFLFNLQAGEAFRSSDLTPDDPTDPDTLRYVEAVAFTSKGTAELSLRPGTYDIVSSRGPEYDTQTTRVTVDAGVSATVGHLLHRVVDTRGWVAGDTHIHSRNSIDSGMTLDQRVNSLAAEGLDWVVSTDHNYVTDYAPYVARNDLNRWLFPVVGVEMTTLESGHFNGYPLNYEVGPITHGSYQWARRTPDEVFDDLRKLGSLGPERTIVQVNHPRDKILGYFSQYNRDALTANEIKLGAIQAITAPGGPAFKTPTGESTFSLKYDALELCNGKLYWEIHHFRVPDRLPPAGVPAVHPKAGEILLDSHGQPAFPGVVDDWFNLLNLGYRFIGVGTGDSHGAYEEAGQFRTMVFVGADDPAALSTQKLVDGLKSRRVVVTNGPLVDFYVNDPTTGAMGQTLQDTSKDGVVSLKYKVTAAKWVGASLINVYRNGLLATSIPIDETLDLAKNPLIDAVDVPLAKNADGKPIDSWFVVEVIGKTNMFPIVRPMEIPPVVLTDAVASLAGPLGLSNDEYGTLRPPETFPVTSYAITNPVWVTRSGDEFQAPGIVPFEVFNRAEQNPHFQDFLPNAKMPGLQVRSARVESRSGDVYDVKRRVLPLFHPRSDNVLDVRKALSRYGHLGGHSH